MSIAMPVDVDAAPVAVPVGDMVILIDDMSMLMDDISILYYWYAMMRCEGYSFEVTSWVEILKRKVRLLPLGTIGQLRFPEV